jgi:hypothetical protein
MTSLLMMSTPECSAVTIVMLLQGDDHTHLQGPSEALPARSVGPPPTAACLGREEEEEVDNSFDLRTQGEN